MSKKRWKKALTILEATFNYPLSFPSGLKRKLLTRTCRCHQKLRHYEKAIELCSESIDIEDGEENSKAFFYRGLSYHNLQKYDEAIRDLKKAHDWNNQDQKINQALHDAEIARKKANRVDYYGLLGVSQDCDEGELKKAFRKRARDDHPDKCSADERDECEKRFQKLTEAYDVLSDPETRKRYDAGESLEEMNNPNRGRQQNPFGQGGFPGGFPGGGGFKFNFGGFGGH